MSDAEDAYNVAEKGFRRKLERRPESSEARIGLGLVLRKQGREQEAMKAFGEGLLKDDIPSD